MYGLLIASAIWSLFHRSTVTIPLRPEKAHPRGAVPAVQRPSEQADHAGFLVGFACGVVLAKGINDRKPAARRVAVAMGVAAAIAIAAAVPLRGVTDARPEMARVIAVEDRTAGAYEKMRDRFTQGRIAAEKLIGLIDRTIMPELQEAAHD